MNYLIIICQILLVSEIYSQHPGKNLQFYAESQNVYYLDSSSIKRVNNIITCRINILNPKNSSGNSTFSVSKIRQYLLNSAENKFYLLGEIAYDSTYKVINPNDPKTVNPTFAKQIKSDSIVIYLAHKLNDLFNEDIFSFEASKNESVIENPGLPSDEISDIQFDTLKINPKIEVTTDSINLNGTDNPPEETLSLSPKTYDFVNEINSEGTLFTDGKLFCFQVSSWKNYSVAESEVNKLIDKGFNAFIVEANLGTKKGVWYRVRVGYFNSKEEALQNQQELSIR